MSAAAARAGAPIALSPHELATLMLVRNAPDQIDMTRTELETLLDCRLISLEPRSGALRRPRLTPAGAQWLEAAARAAREPRRGADLPADDDLR